MGNAGEDVSLGAIVTIQGIGFTVIADLTGNQLLLAGSAATRSTAAVDRHAGLLCHLQDGINLATINSFI